MNKAELKIKWGVYCDTDKLVDDTMKLLTKYSHGNTEHGVCVLLDTYFTNKKDLIDLFKKSNNYVGDMRIVVDIELERGIDANEINIFLSTFMKDVNARSVFDKYEDENGKTLADYLLTGIDSFKASDLLTGDTLQRLEEHSKNRSKFTHDGRTVASRDEFLKVCGAINVFKNNTNKTICERLANYMQTHDIKGTYTEGMKTSRAFNRLCSQYKINTLPEYNRLFARYSDMVSGLKRRMKFFISLNPLDYLTMSFGNSWASCHTIDKRNRRDMPNDYSGAYCGGTISYMLDSSSIITYVHYSIPDNIEEGKIYRNMFHYHNGTLIQGRVYPQGNDGATDLYKEFRNTVQNELSAMLELTNTTWTKRSGGCGNNVYSHGVHYRDYIYQSDCNVSYPNQMPAAREHVVHIGHRTICVKCGDEIDSGCTGRLNHSYC